MYDQGMMKLHHAGLQDDIDRLLIGELMFLDLLVEDDVIHGTGKVREAVANLVRVWNDPHTPVVTCGVMECDPGWAGRHRDDEIQEMPPWAVGQSESVSSRLSTSCCWRSGPRGAMVHR